MSGSRRINIRLETHELKVIRLGRRQRGFCESCGTETEHLTVSQAAVVLAISEMNVFRLADDRRLHWLETADGRLMLCANSLGQTRT